MSSGYVFTEADAAHDMCIYCGHRDPTGRQAWGEGHADNCPTVTDVWPVGPVDVAGELHCTACHHPFALGEAYTTSDRVVCCLGCAATGAHS